MGAALDLDLRDDLVLHHFGDDADEAVPGRPRPRLARRLVARELDGETGADSQGFRTAVLTESVQAFSRFRTPGRRLTPALL
jgi:hypothetical protein